MREGEDLVGHSQTGRGRRCLRRAAGLTVADLTERLRAAMNQARKQRDQARTLLLSTILADLKNRELELNHPPSDDEAAEVLRRGIKRRRQAAEQDVAGKRQELAHRELAEVKMLAEV